MNDSSYEGSIQCGCAALRYHSYGQGTPFIMLHGNMQSSELFAAQVAFFQDSYRVITIDSRGHGRSEHGNKHLSVDVLAEDVLMIMDALSIKRAVFLGFSDGGNITLRLASRAPERVLSMILVGANIDAHGLKAFVRIPAQIGYSLLRVLHFIPWCSRLSQKLYLVAKNTGILPQELQQLQIKTLFITGERDVTKHSHTLHMVRQIPGAKLAVVKKAGHNLIKKHAQVVNELIQVFLSEQV